MLSDSTQASSFITILYATLQAVGLSTGIACCDAEGWNDQVTYTAQITAAGAEQYVLGLRPIGTLRKAYHQSALP
jgi:hypothetical protein